MENRLSGTFFATVCREKGGVPAFSGILRCFPVFPEFSGASSGYEKRELPTKLPHAVRIKVLRYNRNPSVYQNIKQTFKAWLPPCPPVFCAALHHACIFLSDNAKVVKIPEFSKCGRFCDTRLYFTLPWRSFVSAVGSVRLKNRASGGGSRTSAGIAFSVPPRGTNVPAIHRSKAGRRGTARFLSLPPFPEARYVGRTPQSRRAG